MIVLYAILGAIWRVVDGSEHAPKFWHLAPALALPLVYIHFGWEVTLAYVVAYASLLDGFHGWDEFGYMRMRYTGYAALACALAGTSLWYIPLAFLAGMLYPTLHLAYSKGFRLPHVGIVNNYTTYCEFVCGAVMFGGVFL